MLTNCRDFFMPKNNVQQIISFIDLTSLNDTDTESTVHNLITAANKGIQGVKPAAICVHPTFTLYACEQSEVPIAVVAGCFPSGQTVLSAKEAEYRALAKTSVDEVDIVINRGLVFSENYEEIAKEIRAARNILSQKKLKVILESGQLNDQQLKKVSEIAIQEDADFIKTSTGKSENGATPHAARIMCETILHHFKSSQKKVGFKASGGIRTYEEAMRYVQVVKEVLGEKWLTPELFRIGASSLYKNLEIELQSV